MVSCHCIQILRAGVKKVEPDFSDFSVVPSDGSRDRRHKSKHRKCNLNIRKKLLYFECDRALEQAVQVGFGSRLSGNILKPVWNYLVQPALGKPALAGMLD